MATADGNKAYTNMSTTFGTVLHGDRLGLAGAIYARGMLEGAILGRISNGDGIYLGCPGDRSGGKKAVVLRCHAKCLHGARQTRKLRDGTGTTRMPQGCGAFNSSRFSAV
jgi:hypothetical protein